MKKTNLIRQNHTAPNRNQLKQMRSYLEELIDSHVEFSSSDWDDVIYQLLSFQAEDGSFSLLDSYKIEIDCAIHYCFEPTYICSALLMKSFLLGTDRVIEEEECALRKALSACCIRQLDGHGYDWLRDKIKAIDYFINCDVKSFLDRNPDFCPEFKIMFFDLKTRFSEMVYEKSYCGHFGESYENDILRINQYLSTHWLFVYGTLMKGQSNHNSFLRNSDFIGDGKLDGFEMYDLGSFPGIVVGDGTVRGEVYRVSDSELEAINRLEGEGDLYIKSEATVSLDSGERLSVIVYVYNQSVDHCQRLYEKYGTDEYVWYVAYGSNLLEERFRFYIQGGYCIDNGREYNPCSDISLPVESRPVSIPYDMYYSNYNLGSWANSAVSFLDVSKKGMSYGRAYKIKRSQLNEIHKQEGKGINWYPDCIQLDSIDGVEAFTFTTHVEKEKEPFSRVSKEYGGVLFRGLKECYSEMGDEEILDYLKGK